MLHRISEWILDTLASVPALFTEQGSQNFMLVRAMFGLIFITLVVYLIAMRPFRSAISSIMRKASDIFTRRRT